jgi:hypothetical protein
MWRTGKKIPIRDIITISLIINCNKTDELVGIINRERPMTENPETKGIIISLVGFHLNSIEKSCFKNIPHYLNAPHHLAPKPTSHCKRAIKHKTLIIIEPLRLWGSGECGCWAMIHRSRNIRAIPGEPI